MKILFRYIFREILVASLIGTLLFTFVLFLRAVGPVMELLIRPSASPHDVFYLFLLRVPQTLRFTIPMGVVVGVLVGLGRLSSDGEITAMRAAGVPSRRCISPIGVFALLGALACAASTLHLNPKALREFKRISETMKISLATAEVQPRVFIESFPDTVLFVQDVAAGAMVRWKGVFIADMRAPEARGSLSRGSGAAVGPRITVASEAVVVPRPEQDRLQLHLPQARWYERSHDPTQYHASGFEQADQVLETEPADFATRSRPFDEMDTAALADEARSGENRLDAGIELHQRLAFPVACLILPMVGIPLAISSQRAGKSVGLVFAVVLVFAYWMILTGGVALAKERLLPVGPAIWMANILFAAAGAYMLSQLDAPNRRDIAAAVSDRFRAWWARWRFRENGRPPEADAPRERPSPPARRNATDREPPGSTPPFPIIDRYLLRMFLFYLAVLVAAFVSIWFVFSFFELLTDMLARQKLALFIPYIYYLTPFLLYETAPLGVLVATLVCFSILARRREITAFKACGISLYRLATPVLAAAVVLSGLLFALDYYYLPETNRKQDAIRDEIKGRPVRTFLRPDRQWTAGRHDRIFYHSFFDPEQKILAGVSVYDFDHEPFQLRRHVSAERARWDSRQQAWVFENGWVREIDKGEVTRFEQFKARAFPDVEEEPAYFLKEVRQHQQMNWKELRGYIFDLTQSGFETVRLQVQLHKKLAFPLTAFAMAVLAFPFSMLAGHRGAVALSIGLAIAYYALNALFEQLGRASQLTPAMAAWAPTLIFALSGAYLFLRVRS